MIRMAMGENMPKEHTALNAEPFIKGGDGYGLIGSLLPRGYRSSVPRAEGLRMIIRLERYICQACI